jgi:hypothetical protein
MSRKEAIIAEDVHLWMPSVLGCHQTLSRSARDIGHSDHTCDTELHRDIVDIGLRSFSAQSEASSGNASLNVALVYDLDVLANSLAQVAESFESKFIRSHATVGESEAPSSSPAFMHCFAIKSAPLAFLLEFISAYKLDASGCSSNCSSGGGSDNTSSYSRSTRSSVGSATVFGLEAASLQEVRLAIRQISLACLF